MIFNRKFISMYNNYCNRIRYNLLGPTVFAARWSTQARDNYGRRFLQEPQSWHIDHIVDRCVDEPVRWYALVRKRRHTSEIFLRENWCRTHSNPLAVCLRGKAKLWEWAQMHSSSHHSKRRERQRRGPDLQRGIGVGILLGKLKKQKFWVEKRLLEHLTIPIKLATKADNTVDRARHRKGRFVSPRSATRRDKEKSKIYWVI